jgi:hypothetical protein
MWAAVRRVRYGSFGTGFEVFPFLIGAINHPTTPSPHVMLHQPRFWSCWVLGRSTEEGVPQHLLDRAAETKEKELFISILHTRLPSLIPPFFISFTTICFSSR